MIDTLRLGLGVADTVGKIGLAFVFDDDRTVGTLACQFLGALGYETRQFETSPAFIAAVKQDPPDVIVLDLALGQTDGIEVMRQLSAMQFGGHILLISARERRLLVDVQTIGASYGLLMLPPLQKPFRLATMREILAAVPARARAQTTGPIDIIRIDPAEALQKNWLELWYQPKVDLRSNRFCGAEALLRARHPKFGVLPPAAFLPVADNDPVHRSLLEFVFRRVMNDWRRLGSKPQLRMSINVPVSAMVSGELMRLFRSYTPGPTFPGLILEVTEDEVIRDASWAREVATQLRLYNAYLSIDDFGAGVASLGRLLDLPFSELKLDGAFVAGCAANASIRAGCEAAVKLARVFKTTICAEGVETAQDLVVLRQLGFDSAQGYLLGRPMTIEKFSPTVLGQPLAEAAPAPTPTANPTPNATSNPTAGPPPSGSGPRLMSVA